MSDNEELTSDCGKTFAHELHTYRNERGNIKACDGSITKRRDDKLWNTRT